SIPVIIIRARVLCIEPTAADGIIKVADFAVTLRPFPEAVVRSTFCSEHRAGRSGTLFGKYLNHASEGPRPVHRALGPAHDLDSVDVVGCEIGEIKGSLQTLIDGNAVNQYLGVFAA